MDQVTLRDAKAADAHAIAEIHVGTWRAAYRGLVPDAQLDALSVEQRTEYWSGALSKPGPSRVVLAEIAGAVVGFCCYGPSRDERDGAEIYAIYVEPQSWRRGAGRALCEHAVREAAAREHPSMTLWVLKRNHSACRFYESLGFAADGATRNAHDRDEVRYRKAIVVS
jgi:ribosomal protein S18 acetylase RimI-like enzyme